jgi:hypothetical protein
MTADLFRTTRPLPEDHARLHDLRQALYDAEQAHAAASATSARAIKAAGEANQRECDARAALKTFLGLPR